MDQESLKVGRRVRTLRDERGLSLRALAEACDLSVNAISMIERDESSPRVSTLHLLARALNVRITDFFESENQRSVVFVRRGDRAGTTSNDITIESIGTGLRNQQLEPFIVTIPGGSSSGEHVEHPGQEFVYCLEGRVEYAVSGDAFILEPGDSLLFDATQSHFFRNAEAARAKILLVLQSPEGTGVARERHMARDTLTR